MLQRSLALLSSLAVLTPLALNQASAAPYHEEYDDLVKLKIMVHLQDKGNDEYETPDEYGNSVWAGSKGESRRLEAFSIKFDDYYKRPKGVKLEYYCHIENYGDVPYFAPKLPKGKWVKQGKLCGTTGKALRLEGLAIRLIGKNAKHYDVYYECHIQDKGDVGPKKNGKFCGTRGEAKRLEALKVSVVKDYDY